MNFKTMRDELEKQLAKFKKEKADLDILPITYKLDHHKRVEKMVLEKLHWRRVGDGKELFDKYVKFTKQDIKDKDTENIVRHSWLWLISRLGDDVRGEKRVIHMRGYIRGDNMEKKVLSEKEKEWKKEGMDWITDDIRFIRKDGKLCGERIQHTEIKEDPLDWIKRVGLLYDGITQEDLNRAFKEIEGDKNRKR